MGGIDKDNSAAAVLNVLAECDLNPEIKITIVMGAKAPWIKEVSILANQLPWRTVLLTNVANMAEQMAEADLAIGAAGGTSWERCCLGLPALLLVIAENQIEATKALVNQKAAIYLGTLNFDDWPTELDLALTNLQNSNGLFKYSQSAARICDWKGSEKVVEKIIASR